MAVKTIQEALNQNGKMIFSSDVKLSQQEMEQKKADSYNASIGDLDAHDGYKCEICKNKGYIATVFKNEMFGYYSEALVPCKCQKVRQTIKRLNRSGLKNIVKDYTFDKYQVQEDWQKAILQKACEFCKDDRHQWFFIGGQSGAGKTHICTAIAVYLLKHGQEVKYMLWRDEITKIKAVVNDHEQYIPLMDELKKTDVLYIDDLFKTGKQSDGKTAQPTAADVNVAFEVINHRYNNHLTTIISSERTLLELNQIDEAVAGRIAEMTSEAGFCINLKKDKSRNWRMKGLVEL